MFVVLSFLQNSVFYSCIGRLLDRLLYAFNKEGEQQADNADPNNNEIRIVDPLYRCFRKIRSINWHHCSLAA